jgi:hypothetical protein
MKKKFEDVKKAANLFRRFSTRLHPFSSMAGKHIL